METAGDKKHQADLDLVRTSGDLTAQGTEGASGTSFPTAPMDPDIVRTIKELSRQQSSPDLDRVARMSFSVDDNGNLLQPRNNTRPSKSR